MPFIQLQFRRGTATQWTSANPVLADGELAIESDTSKFKIGNGNASWTLLPYGGLVGPTGTIGNTVSIDVSFNGNIFVGRDVSFGGKLAVRNDVSFNTELRVGGNINIRSSASSISSGTGALIVAGGVGVGGNVWTGGNLVIGGDASFNNRLFVENDVSFGAKLCVQSDVSFNGNTSVALLPFYTGNATITPATNQLVTKKYVDENGGTILLGANNVWTGNNNFNGNTSVAILPVYTGNASVTPATNQLVTKKYVDENGGTILLSGNNIWTANNTFNGSRFYVNADASFNSKLTVSGDASLNSNLFVGRNMVVGGDVSFNDNMSVQSDSSFNNRLYVGRQIGVGVTANASYALDVLGNINLTGNLYLNNKLFSITSADISLNANLMVGADASFNGNVFIARTLNLRKTVLTGAAIGSPTSIAAATPIVEITGAGASTAYFNLANGSYAGQTLTIISATNGGGGGLFVNAVASNIIFNGSLCSQMRFSNSFQTVNLIWSADVNDWIVASWQGVNFGGVSMNFGTYTSGDITLGAAGRVNINPGVGGMVVGSDSSLNGNLSVGGTDSSFNGNLYTGGYINAEGFIERFVNVASSSGTYTADFNNGIIIYVNAFSGSSTPTLSITNLPTVLNQSYVFTVVYSGLPTSTYFSALNINGVSVPVSGSVSLTAASSYYVHQFCIFFTDATNLGNNFVVQNFNSSAPLSLVSPLVSGNLSVNGNINLTGGNIFQNGVLFSGGGGGGVGTSGNSLSLSGNLYVGGDVSFNGKLTGNGDVSLNQRLFIGGDVSFGGNLVVRRTTASTNSSTGALVVAGGVGVGGNVEVGGVIDIASTTASTSSTTGALTVAGANAGIGVAGNVYAGGIINTTLATASTSTSTGALILNGANAGIGVAGNVYTGGIVNVGSTAVSTSAVTGALRVAGGAGVSGNLYVDGVVNINNTITTSGVITTTNSTVSTSTGTGAIVVNGGVGVGGNLWASRINVNLDSSMNGNLRIGATTASTSTSTGALIVSGGVGVAGFINGISVGRGNGNYTTNTAIGLNALASNTEINNTAVGVNALLSNTTGNNNAAVGTYSLQNNTPGRENTAFGMNALINNTTGNFNTAVGVSALYYGVDKIYNTAIGHGAGLGSQANFVGSFNTFIGSGTNSTGTFGNSTAIGYGAQITLSNQIKLGRNTEYVYCGNALRLNPTGAHCNIRNLNDGENLDFGIGTKDYLTVNANGIDVSGNVSATGVVYSNNVSTNSLNVNSAGGVTQASINTAGTINTLSTVTAVSFNATSDYRIKQNVHSIIEDASFNIDVLRPITYTNLRAGKQDIGFIAHEVGEHYPYLVNGEKDGEEMQSLNYTGIIGILTKEIQELKKKDAIKEQRIQDLEKMVLDILANK